MNVVDKALATQLANIEKRSGKSLAELAAIVKKCGLTKHGEMVNFLKSDHGMGHGDANTLVHYVRGAAESKPAADGDPLAEIYTGPKEALRPIHDKLMAAINKFGEFEVAPKKTYISLRRKKQFAMIGPATNTRVEVGLNMKSVSAKGRLEAMPPGGMCQYKVKVTDAKEVDSELIAWVRQAYDAAG